EQSGREWRPGTAHQGGGKSAIRGRFDGGQLPVGQRPALALRTGARTIGPRDSNQVAERHRTDYRRLQSRPGPQDCGNGPGYAANARAGAAGKIGGTTEV